MLLEQAVLEPVRENDVKEKFKVDVDFLNNSVLELFSEFLSTFLFALEKEAVVKENDDEEMEDDETEETASVVTNSGNSRKGRLLEKFRLLFATMLTTINLIRFRSQSDSISKQVQRIRSLWVKVSKHFEGEENVDDFIPLEFLQLE